MNDRPLHGVRIWLSGSVPDGDEVAAKAIPAFVATIAREAFAQGATIVHGSHPTIVPALLEAAARVVAARQPTPLVLAISRFFADQPDRFHFDLDAWRKVATVELTPRGLGGDEATQERRSLQILRDAMAARCDVIVAIGGKWWEEVRDKAGVPDEILIAQQRGIPCFVLGGLGGATKSFVEARNDKLASCMNGLDAPANEALATLTDIGRLVSTVLAQITRLPLAARTTSDGQPFRILALDGGGLRGAFTAAVLARWEKELAKKPSAPSIVEHFDLVAGTSTGGILALGLGMGLQAAQLEWFYLRHGAAIFPPASWTRRRLRSLRWIVLPKFDHNRLEAELKFAFAKAPLGHDIKDSKCRLLVPAFSATTDRPHLFSTPHREGVWEQRDAVTIATGTASAPTYFSPKSIFGAHAGYQVIDGGVWANNPSLAALAEAVGPLGVPLSRIRMLSIGTTYGTSRTARTLWGMYGLAGYAARVAGLMIKAGQHAVGEQCRMLLERQGDGHEPGNRWLRIDAAAAAEQLDDVRGIAEWANLGTTEAQQRWAEVQSTFLNGVAAMPWS